MVDFDQTSKENDETLPGAVCMSISYDAMAADYAIHRSVHPGVLHWVIEFCNSHSLPRVLEVGCGTGNYVISLAAATSARCSGLEPSGQMLHAARQRATTVSWCQGSAESLPFSDGTFDLLYSVDVIHHVQGREALLREGFRVLAGGGWLVTVTDSEQIIRQRILSHYFPESIAPELQRYPKPGEIPRLLSSAGFGNICEEVVEAAYKLSDAAPFERKTFSGLHLISDDAFRRGLARLKQDLQVGPVPCVSRYVIHGGRKPTTA